MFFDIHYRVTSWLKSRRALGSAEQALAKAVKAGTVHKAVCTFEGVAGTSILDVDFEIFDKDGTLLSPAEMFPGIHVTALRVAMDRLGKQKGFRHQPANLVFLPKTHSSAYVLTYSG